MSPVARSLRDARRLAQLTERLYDSRTPERVRRTLSYRVAELRCRVLRAPDPLAAMIAASESPDEC